MTQAELWFENEYEALRATIDSMGGAKSVATKLWPAKPALEAQRLLLKCLDPERAEKLALDEIFHIWRLARAKDIHILAQFVAYSMNYEEPKPIKPEQRKAEKMAQIETLLAQAAALAKQLEGIKG